MRRAGKIATGIAALMMTAGSAVAADVPEFVTPVAPPPPVAAPGFDWAGPYFGGYLGANFDPGGAGIFFDAGLQAGYNWVLGNVLVGVEAYAGFQFIVNPWGNSPPYGGVDARVGTFVGDRAVVYATAGIQRFLVPGPGFLVPLAIGVEVAVRDALSVFGEIGTMAVFPCCGIDVLRVLFGVNFHPGN